MSLRNAFEDMATDRLLRHVSMLLNFARDNANRLRVSVDNTVTVSGNVGISGTPNVTGYNYLRNAGSSLASNTSESWYGQSSHITVDARESLRQQQRVGADLSRQRWRYT